MLPLCFDFSAFPMLWLNATNFEIYFLLSTFFQKSLKILEISQKNIYGGVHLKKTFRIKTWHLQTSTVSEHFRNISKQIIHIIIHYTDQLWWAAYIWVIVSWPKKNLMISKGHSSGRDIFKQFFVLSKTLYYFLRTANFLP